MVQIKWTKLAVEDLKEIHDFISRDSAKYAYDRKSHVGVLDKALDTAATQGWIIVSMKDDWNKIFPAK